MKERCEECRYCIIAVMKRTGMAIGSWCRIKDRLAPKNACMFWRPRALGGAQK
jgi:hypothetical protein